MAETAAGRTRRRRWPWLLLGIGLLGLTGALVLHHYTRPQRISAFLASEVRTQLGAELSLGAGARYAFLPTLRAVLPAPVLRQPGAAQPIARAEEIRVTLPWHSLWREPFDIRALRLLRPQLDLDALDAWLATRPASTGPLPDLRIALVIEDGTLLRHGEPIARGVDASLADRGEAITWLQGWRERPDAAALLPPASGSASAAEVRIGELQLQGVELRIEEDGNDAAPRR